MQTAAASPAPASAFGLSVAAASASELGIEAAEGFSDLCTLHELRTLHIDGGAVLAGETVSGLVYDLPCVIVGGVRGSYCALAGVGIHGIVLLQQAFCVARAIIPHEVPHGCVVLYK